MKVANRQNGFYKAMASDIVTDVMEGITEGQVDVALVFDDSSSKLLGIFTETDYIKV
jgi:CBS domain-containing protein